jgi:hypothetical protein
LIRTHFERVLVLELQHVSDLLENPRYFGVVTGLLAQLVLA